MSTPAGHPSRGRLALALTAVAAATAPASAAEAKPVAAVRSDRASSRVTPDVTALHGSPAVADTATASPLGSRVNVQFGAAPASSTLYRSSPAPAAPTSTPGRADETDDDVVAYHPDAVADLELIKVSAESGGAARLALDASHDGTVRVKWSGGGQSGSEWHQVRAGHSQLRLKGARGISHVRLRATLTPTGVGASASAGGSFKLRR